MNPDDALPTLLDRVAAAGGGAAYFSAQELAGWPASMFARMQEMGLLVPSTPAASVVCPGCEEECAMPVEVATTPAGTLRFFVVCDRRDDTARIRVPRVQLEQWQCSPRLLADGVAKLVGLRRSLRDDDARRLDLGVLKGTQASAHVVLHVRTPRIRSACSASCNVLPQARRQTCADKVLHRICGIVPLPALTARHVQQRPKGYQHDAHHPPPSRRSPCAWPFAQRTLSRHSTGPVHEPDAYRPARRGLAGR